ncbi:MAG: DUF1501 domain-containing protein [Solirubrobacteraceae bacterium]|jgi:uncharacterized protein (DUF1501 family)|nr:DUF1501 domain-containing protein [Solirubrobacteraceae bacterium]
MTDDLRPPTTSGEAHALRCADCARSDSLVTDLPPTSALPIPAEALTGFSDGVPHARRTARGVDRRTFLRNGLAGVASVYSATHLDWGSIWEAAVAEAAEPMQKSLVCVFLNGGNDGLNTIVPVSSTQYAAYEAARSNIARVIGPSAGGRVGTTPMGGTGSTLAFANAGVSGAGNNGDTKGFDTLYGDGSGGPGSDLAVFPAADYTPANRSHFESRDYWFAGALQKLQTGWLGRWLDLYGSKANPLQAVSLDSSLSKQIRTGSAPVCAIENLGGAKFQLPSMSGDANAEIAKLAGVGAAAGNDGLARARQIYGLTVDVSNRLGGLRGTQPGGGYPPNSDLSRKLQLAATLLGAGLGTRIVTVDWGSFDTHGDQLPSHDAQLGVLSRGLAAFQADLAARGIEDKVVTMVFSEFGRRIASNDSAGTDHGAGGMMLVSGSAVRGGLAGEHPGVLVDDDGDLVTTTDFRSVYQALIAEWLGGEPGAVLPGGPHPALKRYDGGSALIG